ncbi:unnamed protein product [Urochloa decumbens]|uniref:Uncharacterized protein n=1 Tax=Urochloa decumbens TaxID=240449 RepID=A0ABC8ZLF3_9POAL
MGRTVCFMVSSLLILVTILSNSPSCQAEAGIDRLLWQPPCFRPSSSNLCTDQNCPYVCGLHGYSTNRAYCSKPLWLCCCPPPDVV